MALEQLKNGAGLSTLSSGIDSSQTTLSVASATPFPTSGNFRIRVDGEIMKVTGVSGTTFTVVRAQEGTSAASHSSGVNVDYFITKGALDAIAAEMFQVGAYASRPASARLGAIYASNDGYIWSKWNGSAWDEYGPAFKITPPGDLGSIFNTWHAQGSATFTQVGSAWQFKIPGETSGAVRFKYKTVPSTPYTLEIGMRGFFKAADYAGVGMVWRDTSGGHIHAGFCYHSAGNGSHLMVDKYDTGGGFNNTYTAIGASQRMSTIGYPTFFKINDDGTFRGFWYSLDGVKWFQYHATTHTNFLTPAYIGIGAQTSNNADVYMEIFHYKEY